MIQSTQLGKQIIQELQLYVQLGQQWQAKGADYPTFLEEIYPLLVEDLAQMQKRLAFLAQQAPEMTAHLLCENTQASLMDIVASVRPDKEKVNQIRYELFPLITETLNDLYFWGLCYPDVQLVKQYYEKDMALLCPLPDWDKAKVELSILVPAYNQLAYTKVCLTYLFRYLPEGISYELILLNHGSKDGTKAYFESLHPTKQINFSKNNKSLSIFGRVIEGKYVLFLSNDVLMMPNVIANLLTCLNSDDSIACVMPACPNVANLSGIDIHYHSLEELCQVAEANNQSNPKRWIQRSRLNSPVLLARADEEAFYTFIGYRYPFYQERFVCFTDDAMAYVARKAGKKCILCEDSYVHHYGSVTVKAYHDDIEIYRKGILAFQRYLGEHPWSGGHCYDYDLMQDLPVIQAKQQHILGIDCGYGDDLFQLRARLFEKDVAKTVTLTHIEAPSRRKDEMDAFFDQYLTDEQAWQHLPNDYYQYILCLTHQSVSNEQIQAYQQALTRTGILVMRKDSLINLEEIPKPYKQNEQWVYYTKM